MTKPFLQDSAIRRTSLRHSVVLGPPRQELVKGSQQGQSDLEHVASDVQHKGAPRAACCARRPSAGRTKGGGGDQGRLSTRTGGGRGDPHGGSNREEIRVFAYTNSDLTLRLR